MPYIKLEDRERYDEIIDKLVDEIGSTGVNPGHLNYIITKLVHEFIPAEPSYTDLNEAVGVLECAKLELFRKVVAPYENSKMKLNGNISDLDNGEITK